MATGLDETGCKLLELLGENGRRSVTSLGRELNLSRTAVQDRMGRLERDGWIEGYTIVTGRPASEQAGHHALLFLTIEVRPCATVLRAVRAIPQVGTVWSLSGTIDAIAEVRVDDVTDLSALTDRIALLDGIGTVTSQIILG